MGFLDDVAGGMLRPHLFCKPIAKRPEDREALLKAALSGHPRLMFGSDSAPHPVHAKEACGCAAGVFTAPIALPRLAALFDGHGALDRLQGFVSGHACSLETGHLNRSSFDLIEDSTWLKSLPVREDFNKGIYQHYRLFTYDDVYNIIAVSYEFAAEL